MDKKVLSVLGTVALNVKLGWRAVGKVKVPGEGVVARGPVTLTSSNTIARGRVSKAKLPGLP